MVLNRFTRLLSFAIFATIFILFSASCEFLGSKYEYGKATDTSVSNLQSSSSSAGRAAYLVIAGNNRQTANECSVEFVVTALDLTGQESLPFDPGATVQITDSKGAQVYTDAGCSQSAPAGQVPAIASTNRARFFLKGAAPGPSTVSATFSNLPTADMGMTWIAGPVKKLAWSVGSSLSAYECVPIVLKATDQNGNLATLSSPMDVRIEVLNNTAVKLYDRGDCLNPSTNVQIPAGAQPLNLWTLSSAAGGATLSATTTQTGVAGHTVATTFIVQDSPRLFLNAIAGNVAANTCVLVTVHTEYQGNAYPVRTDTVIRAEKTPPSALIFASEDCTGPSSSSSVDVTIPNSGSVKRFSVRTKYAGNVDVMVSSPGYVSDALTVHYVAAAPSKLVWIEQPSLSMVSQCTSRFRFQLKDSYDNTAVATGPFDVLVTPSGTAGGGAQYYSHPNCTGSPGSTISLSPGDSEGELYAVAIHPGALESLLSSTGIVSPPAAVVQVAPFAGTPNKIVASFNSPADAGECLPVRLQSQDGFNNVLVVQPDDLVMDLSSLSSTVRFYDSASCDTILPQATIAHGHSETTIYVWNSAVETATSKATDVASNLQVTFDIRTVPGAPAAVQLVDVPATAIRNLCSSSPFKLKLIDRVGNPTAARSNTNITLTSTKANETQFFTDANCQPANLKTQVTIPGGATVLGDLYFKISAAPGPLNLIGIGPMGISAGSAQVTVSNPQTHLVMTSTPSPVTAGDCAAVDVTSVGPAGQPEIYDPITVSIGSGSALGASVLYSDACSTHLTNTVVTLSPSANPFRFYVKSSLPENFSVTATSQTSTDVVSTTINVIPGPLNKVVLLSNGPGQIMRGTWAGNYTVVLKDRENNVITAAADSAIVLASPATNAGIAASTSGAGTPIVAAGASSGIFALRSTAAGTISLSVSVLGIASNNIPVVVKAPTPGVTGIDPMHGPMTGDTQVVISGSAFEANVSVSLGGTACAVDTWTETTIHCHTGRHPTGNVDVDVVVTNVSSDPGTLVGGFHYDALAPTVSSVTPSSGSTLGETEVTITGTNFSDSTTATVGGVNCAKVSFTGTTFVCKTGAHPVPGAVDVVVTNPSGGSATKALAFTYVRPQPTVTAITPLTGPIAGGRPVTIMGTEFQANVGVKIGGITCDVNQGTRTTTQIQCTTRGGNTLGAKPVVVTNPDGGTVTFNSYTFVNPPAVTGVSPLYGPTAGGTRITLSGTGFLAGATVTVGGVECTSVNVTPTTQIQCTTGAHPSGEVSIVVTNPDSQTGSRAFTYADTPTITSVTPNYGPAAGGTSIAIVGTNFLTTSTVTVGGIVCTPPSAQSVTDTRITCNTGRYTGTVPTNGVLVNVVVTTVPAVLSVTRPNAFTYGATPPSITSVSPNNGPRTGGTRITITGSGFSAGSTVKVGGTNCLDPVLTGTTQIVCTTPAHVPGAVGLVVTTPAGVSCSTTYTYNATSEISCYQLVRQSRSYGDASYREFAAAFLPKRTGLDLRNGMGFEATAPFLYDTTAVATGYFPNRVRVRNPPTGVQNAPYPSSISAGGLTVALMTGSCVGTPSCGAYYTQFYSPLVIDLQGKGIALSAPNAGVKFDIEGTGEKLPISWPTNPQNSVFLVLDKNNNGKIESIHELFGNNTVGPDGATARDGFAALAKYDLNRDRFITSQDAVFNQLRVWKDLNKNGTTEAGELFTLQSAGIRDIDLNYINVNERNDFYGNETLERSVIHLANGNVQRILDIWFVPGPPTP